MPAKVIKLKHAIMMNAFFLLLGCMLALNLVSLEQHHQVDLVAPPPPSSILADNKIDQFLLIFSAPDNFQRRQVVRDTWLRLSNHSHNFRHSFVIGIADLTPNTMKQIKNEQLQFNDLLLLTDHSDRYETLTLKLITSLSKINNKYKNLKYLIKCDDDSFVRLDVVLKELKLMLNQNVYWGYFKGNAKIKSEGKWAESDWFLCDRYLPYALGGGYILSKSIVDFVSINRDVLHQYKSEDVALGVWTAPLSNVKRVHDLRFDTEWTTRGCNDRLVIRHKQSPEDMIQMYKSLEESGGKKLCKNAYSIRQAYQYNWKVLPSLCCR